MRKQLEEACNSVVIMLLDIGYIGDRTKQELLYRIATGDNAVHAELKARLIQLAQDIER